VDRAATDLGALSASLTEGIENELERAGQRLEFAARSTGDLELTAAIERLTSTGFVAVELMDPDDLVADVEVTNNFLQRAAESTAIGATRVLDGRVGVVVGSPIQSGERRGEVLVGVYDAGDMLATVGAARVGDTGEALLSVRNAEDDLVIFSPSRHNSNSPVGRIDADTTESIEAAFESTEPLVLSSANINGRDSVSVLREIESPRWVLLTSIDRDEVRVDAVPWWLLPMVAVVGGLALIPVVLLRRRLREVVRAAQQLSRGRLTTEIVDPTEDEIGLLARTLQSLDDRLQSDTEQRGRSAAMLQHRATHDPLTGLANRARLVEELTIALNNRDSLAVLFCDIDDFKGINDSQGHEGGDIVLKFVANQLASVCGSSELISRFGGDEFCVLSRSEPHEARVLASSDRHARLAVEERRPGHVPGEGTSAWSASGPATRGRRAADFAGADSPAGPLHASGDGHARSVELSAAGHRAGHVRQVRPGDHDALARAAVGVVDRRGDRRAVHDVAEPLPRSRVGFRFDSADLRHHPPASGSGVDGADRGDGAHVECARRRPAEFAEPPAQERVEGGDQLGVPFGQGYLWHAPISALALTPLLGRASRWSRKKPAPQKD